MFGLGFKRVGGALVVAALLLMVALAAASVRASQIDVCFSPPLPGTCDPLATVIQEIDGSHNIILIQMYSLTSPEIVTALVNAKNRAVDVRAIVDRSQLDQDPGDTSAVNRLALAGIQVLVDNIPGLMHDKIMIIDDKTVLTGSLNYTWSAEHRNAENLLVINDPKLAAEYAQNWKGAAARSQPLATAAESGLTSQQETSAGAIVGNRRSMIYEWPGCPYYYKIAPRNRINFPSRQAAEAAGYHAATNCQ
ncbi:MAG TPA: phospholipase D family protein [Candidatus Binataceae bacterium]|nr:phospholipase D family protein [Candidatus Binataceae bacterium]